MYFLTKIQIFKSWERPDKDTQINKLSNIGRRINEYGLVNYEND